MFGFLVLQLANFQTFDMQFTASNSDPFHFSLWHTQLVTAFWVLPTHAHNAGSKHAVDDRKGGPCKIYQNKTDSQTTLFISLLLANVHDPQYVDALPHCSRLISNLSTLFILLLKPLLLSQNWAHCCFLNLNYPMPTTFWDAPLKSLRIKILTTITQLLYSVTNTSIHVAVWQS